METVTCTTHLYINLRINFFLNSVKIDIQSFEEVGQMTFLLSLAIESQDIWLLLHFLFVTHYAQVPLKKV